VGAESDLTDTPSYDSGSGAVVVLDSASDDDSPRACGIRHRPRPPPPPARANRRRRGQRGAARSTRRRGARYSIPHARTARDFVSGSGTVAVRDSSSAGKPRGRADFGTRPERCGRAHPRPRPRPRPRPQNRLRLDVPHRQPRLRRAVLLLQRGTSREVFATSSGLAPAGGTFSIRHSAASDRRVPV
jgi:hypothetical protein